VVIAESVYQGKKFTSADTDEPTPKFQSDGPFESPQTETLTAGAGAPAVSVVRR
jgi:hypothetical protein